MATITSTQNGDWSLGTTWVGGSIPQDEDSVILEHEVTYDLGQTSLSFDIIYLNLGGKLIFPTTQSSDLNLLQYIEILGGDLEVGTSVTPIPSTYTARILRSTSPNASSGALIYGGYTNYESSVITVYGDPAYYGSISETELTAEWSSGNTITVSGDVTSAWNVGDFITLTNDDYDSIISLQPQEYASYTATNTPYISRTVTIQSLVLNGSNTDITVDETFNTGTYPFAIGSKVYYMSRNVSIGNIYDTTALNNLGFLGTADVYIYRDVGTLEIDNTYFGISNVTMNSLPTMLITNCSFVSRKNITLNSDEIVYENNFNYQNSIINLTFTITTTSIQNNILLGINYLRVINNTGSTYTLGSNVYRIVSYLGAYLNNVIIDTTDPNSFAVLTSLLFQSNDSKFTDSDSSVLTSYPINYLLYSSERCYIEIDSAKVESYVFNDSNESEILIDQVNCVSNDVRILNASDRNKIRGLTTYYSQIINTGSSLALLYLSLYNEIKAYINSTNSYSSVLVDSSNNNEIEIYALTPSLSNGVFSNSYGNRITGSMNISYSDFIKNPSTIGYIAEYLLLDDNKISYEVYNSNYTIDYLDNTDIDWIAPDSGNPWILKLVGTNITNPIKLSPSREMFNPVGVGSTDFILSIYPTGFSTPLDNTNIYVVLSYFNQVGGYRRTIISSKNTSQTFTNDQWNDITFSFTQGSEGPVYFNIYFENISDPTSHVLIDPSFVIY